MPLDLLDRAIACGFRRAEVCKKWGAIYGMEFLTWPLPQESKNGIMERMRIDETTKPLLLDVHCDCHRLSIETLRHLLLWGCKPEPPKFPSPELQPGEERVQVDYLAAALEGVVSENGI